MGTRNATHDDAKPAIITKRETTKKHILRRIAARLCFLHQDKVANEKETTMANATETTAPAKPSHETKATPPDTPKVLLPQKKKYASDLIVLLDIDKTMVASSKFDLKADWEKHVAALPTKHCEDTNTFKTVDYHHESFSPDGVFHMNFRPGLHDFIKEVASTYEVTRTYAEAVASLLDPDGIYFSKDRIWSEEHVTWSRNRESHYKDLTKLPLGRDDLRRVVLVDDNDNTLMNNPYNVFRVSRFRDDPKDNELQKVLKCLQERLQDAGDVRPILAAKFQERVQMIACIRGWW